MPGMLHKYIGNLRTAGVDGKWTATYRFEDSPVGLRTWMLPQRGSRIILGEAPAMRRVGPAPFVAVRQTGGESACDRGAGGTDVPADHDGAGIEKRGKGVADTMCNRLVELVRNPAPHVVRLEAVDLHSDLILQRARVVRASPYDDSIRPYVSSMRTMSSSPR